MVANPVRAKRQIDTLAPTSADSRWATTTFGTTSAATSKDSAPMAIIRGPPTPATADGMAARVVWRRVMENRPEP